MPTVHLRHFFIRAARKFTRKNIARSAAVKDTLKKFQADPDYSSLHLEKLSGSKYWTVRIDGGNRMFFVWSDKGDTAIFFYIGPHDSYKTMK
jgi:hypothetical protein